jgi:molybdopterin molybdotransferase
VTDFISWEDAREHVLSRVKPLPHIEVATPNALGHATAERVISPEFMPPFANSAVDGFAVLALDTQNASPQRPARLQVIAHRTAGPGDPARITRGQAIRIMTGAPIPDGAEAVVMLEDTDAWDPAQGRGRPSEPAVAIHKPAEPGQNIRPKGESVQAGDILLEPGHLIRPPEIGMLISVGVRNIQVHPLPRVAVLSSGDEIVLPELDPGPGQIRDSNRPAILSALRRRGFPVLDLGWVPDDEDRLTEAVKRGARDADFVITSGGVSVGDRDLTHRVLSRLGTVNAFKVAIKPGQPQVFGEVEGVPVYGLPGNPVSSLVVFDVFVLPALRKISGWGDVLRPLFMARLSWPIQRKGGRTEFVRVRLETDNGGWMARSTGPQGSGILSSMTRANGYAILPAAVEHLEAGALVLCMLWED